MAAYALNAGYHVVIEGLLYADHYGEMLDALVGEHRGVSRCSYLNVPYEETLARHATKPDLAYLAQVTERELSEWYRELDVLPRGIETVIGADSSLKETVNYIMRDTGLRELPSRDL